MMRITVALAALFFCTLAIAEDKVSISGLQVVNASAAYSVVQGVAHNNTDTTLTNVFVKFKLYDQQGTVVGNTIAHGADLGPGENWKFSAPATVPFAEAKLSSVQVY
ncbi:FxLYD domain-containing protein [Pseudomonas fluorescens]|uniref:FxLYD domain-containing protein n=1 Tax=Pseudomonas fluorescens TaxID=294 RepID=UPI000346E6AA|nr:FxLYD domain-containing protein [Pseudomonas fluorescens]